MNIKKWEIIPEKSVGPLEFGTDREIVRKTIGEKYKPFKKSLFSKSLSDSYDSFHTYYSENDQLIAIEFFDGIELSINSKILYPGTLANAKSLIKNITEIGNSYISKEYSIGMTLSDSNTIETLLVGSKGYYK